MATSLLENASMTGKQDSSVFKNAILNTLEMQP